MAGEPSPYSNRLGVGRPEFDPCQGQWFSLPRQFQTGLETHSAHPTGREGLFTGANRLEREAGQLPPLSAKVKNARSYNVMASS
jgi:hypothetical protein